MCIVSNQSNVLSDSIEYLNNCQRDGFPVPLKTVKPPYKEFEPKVKYRTIVLVSFPTYENVFFSKVCAPTITFVPDRTV